MAPPLCAPNVTCNHAKPVAKPTVKLCASFCLSLFRSCGKVVPRGGTASIAEKYFESNRHGRGTIDKHDDAEMVAARKFCLDQFRHSFTGFAVSIMEYDAQAHDGVRCFGQEFAKGTAGISADCDPFEDDRFWHVMSESMEFKHGLGLALVSLMLLAAAACVGYAMTVARRRAEWVSERWIRIQENGSSRSRGVRRRNMQNTTTVSGGASTNSNISGHAGSSSSARDDVDAMESDSLLFSEQMLAAEDGVASVGDDL